MRRVLPLILATALAACATPSTPPPVPAPLAETMPLPPVTPDPMIWQPGHWDWTGAGYSWTAGQWVLTDTAGHDYMPGYWTDAGTWVAPHWLR